MTPERVAVVAVTFLPGQVLARFLESLQYATVHPVDIVLADNGAATGAEDAAVKTAAERPDVRLVSTGGNLGYGGGANVGVKATTAEFVVVANPDIAWEPGSLDALLAAANRWPTGAAFGPLIRTPDGAVYPSARRLPSLGSGVGHALLGWWLPRNRWTAGYRRERERPAERTAGWLSGSCLLLRRDAFDAVGGFDTSYFMYFEDLDLGDRLTKAGWHNVYVPSAVVIHEGGHATSRDAARMAREHHRSARRYLSRRYPGWRWWPVRAMLNAGLTGRSLLARAVPRVAQGAPPQGPREGGES